MSKRDVQRERLRLLDRAKRAISTQQVGKRSSVPTSAAAAGQGPDKESASTKLVRIAEELYELCRSDMDEAFAIPRTGPKVVHMLRGARTSLRAQLAREFYRQFGKAASQQALASALMTIEGIAQDAAPRVLNMRVARHGESLWLDMGDDSGSAIRISPKGWRVEGSVPVLFKRTVLTGVFGRPCPHGGVDEIWRWLNVTENDRPLVLAWLVSALFPDVPHPVLHLSGEQGSGKSTATRLLVGLVDPSPVPLRKAPRDGETWVTAACGSWAVGLDNLSDIPAWLSDSICRAVTGDGDVRRRLYSDADLSIFAFRRCIVLNGIDVGSLRGDLADRVIPIALCQIGPAARREEHELLPRMNAAHARCVGAILNVAVEVLRTLPHTKLASRPRMADFARVLAAVDALFGTHGLARYVAKQSAMAVESLDGDKFMEAVGTMHRGRRFEGTAGQLLESTTPSIVGWKPPRGWPANARAVTQRLRRQAPEMRKAGWTVDDLGGSNKNHTTRWVVMPPSDTRDGPSCHSPTSPDLPQARLFLGSRASVASNASQESDDLSLSPERQ